MGNWPTREKGLGTEGGMGRGKQQKPGGGDLEQYMSNTGYGSTKRPGDMGI